LQKVTSRGKIRAQRRLKMKEEERVLALKKDGVIVGGDYYVAGEVYCRWSFNRLVAKARKLPIPPNYGHGEVRKMENTHENYSEVVDVDVLCDYCCQTEKGDWQNKRFYPTEWSCGPCQRTFHGGK
jgi:hypothetical protein